jgi:hypothetical protein
MLESEKPKLYVVTVRLREGAYRRVIKEAKKHKTTQSKVVRYCIYKTIGGGYR